MGAVVALDRSDDPSHFGGSVHFAFVPVSRKLNLVGAIRGFPCIIYISYNPTYFVL